MEWTSRKTQGGREVATGVKNQSVVAVVAAKVRYTTHEQRFKTRQPFLTRIAARCAHAPTNYALVADTEEQFESCFYEEIGQPQLGSLESVPGRPSQAFDEAPRPH